jgi:hypothetical protein
MQIHQILVRPQGNTVIIVFVDPVGRRNTMVFDSTGNATVQALIDECQQRLPPDEEHPDKSEIEQEIAELEYRLTQLKQSIGVT